MIIIGTTSKGAATEFAGIPIGLALTLIHLVSIPVTDGQSSAQHCAGAVRGRRISRAALAVLGCPCAGGHGGRRYRSHVV